MGFEIFDDILNIINFGTEDQLNFSGMSDCAFDFIKKNHMEEVGRELSSMLSFFKNNEHIPDKEAERIYKEVDDMQERLKEHYLVMLMECEAIDEFEKAGRIYLDSIQKRIQFADNALDAMSNERKKDDVKTRYMALEKRIKELELTMTVIGTFNSQMQLIRNNEMQMAQKLQSTLVNSLAMWRGRVANAKLADNSAEIKNAELMQNIEELLRLQKEGAGYLNVV